MADDYLIKARIVVDDSAAAAGLRNATQSVRILEKTTLGASNRMSRNLRDAFSPVRSTKGLRLVDRNVLRVERDFRKLGATGRRELSSVDTQARKTGMGLTAALGGLAVGAVAGLGAGAAARGIIGMHTEIENAEGSIATLSSALFNMPIDESLGLAKQQVRGLSEDAAKGVGELKDYTKAFQMLLAPTSAAGANLEQIRAFTRQSLTAGFSMKGVPGLEQAPLDIVQALQQGINERMTPIAARVIEAAGVGADKFNKMKVAEKMKVLQEGFSKFEAGAELLGQGWDAQTATLKDQLKQIGRTLTRPVFDRWTSQLRTVNKWLEDNKDRIGEIAEVYGAKLLRLWDHLIDKAGTYAGIVAGAAVAQSLPPSLLSPGRSRAAGKGGGGLSTVLSSGFVPAVSPGADLFGKRRGVVKPSSFAPLAPLSGLVKLLARSAGPLAIVVTAVTAMFGAFEEFPSLASGLRDDGLALMDSFGMLGAAFGSLTAKGSALNVIGWALIRPFVGLGTAISYVIRGVALFVETIGLLSLILGTAIQKAVGTMKMLYALATGDREMGLEGADQFRAAKTRQKEQADVIAGRMATILGLNSKNKLDEDAPITPGEPKGGPAVSAAGTTVNIGSVKVDARSVVNDDPARVGHAWEKVMDEVQRNPRQARRRASPLIG